MTGQGWIAYNIEYRRVGPFGGGGWPRTFEDVSDAIDAVDQVEGVDRQRVATCGHSAGGQLALWAASARSQGDPRRPPPSVDVCAAVSLAGVTDLAAAAHQLSGVAPSCRSWAAIPMMCRIGTGLAVRCRCSPSANRSSCCTGCRTAPCRPP